MKILFLGSPDSPLVEILSQAGDSVVQTEEKLSLECLCEERYDFLISYGYRHILRKEVLDLFPDRAVNLHISMLPWNRGAAPNFWSWLDDTPKGVTIHYINEGVDTGDIITQREVVFESNETLSSSYKKLQREICELFRSSWLAIREARCPRKVQEGGGSCHRMKDMEPFEYLLTNGWETPVNDIKRSV